MEALEEQTHRNAGFGGNSSGVFRRAGRWHGGIEALLESLKPRIAWGSRARARRQTQGSLAGSSQRPGLVSLALTALLRTRRSEVGAIFAAKAGISRAYSVS